MLIIDIAIGIDVLKRWLQPEDPVVADASEAPVPSAQERDEATCMWVKPYLTRFLKGDEQVLSVTGKPGSGKTVLSTVIDDYLQHPVGGTRYMPISASISQFLLLLILPSDLPNQPCRWSDPRQHHPERRRQDYYVANV
jgi:hypothetical protein